MENKSNINNYISILINNIKLAIKVMFINLLCFVIRKIRNIVTGSKFFNINK